MGLDSNQNLTVAPYAPTTAWSYHVQSAAAQSDVTVKAAPATGQSIYVTDIVISNGSANALTVLFEEGTTTGVLGTYYLPGTIGSNIQISFKTPKKLTAATLMSVTTTQAVSVIYTIDVTGYTGP